MADLNALAATTTGGFPAYGAHRLVFELLGSGPRTGDALALLDRAIAFKRERGLPTMSLTLLEWDRWCEVHGPGTWRT